MLCYSLLFYVILCIGNELLKSVPSTLRNWSGIVVRCRSSVLGQFSLYTCHIRSCFEIFSEISTSTNKSRPGTCSKMCSRTWEYGRFQYHQKILAQKWSYGLSKCNLGFWAIVARGKILNWCAICQPSTSLNVFWKKTNRWHLNQEFPKWWGFGCMILRSGLPPHWNMLENY